MWFFNDSSSFFTICQSNNLQFLLTNRSFLLKDLHVYIKTHLRASGHKSSFFSRSIIIFYCKIVFLSCFYIQFTFHCHEVVVRHTKLMRAHLGRHLYYYYYLLLLLHKPSFFNMIPSVSDKILSFQQKPHSERSISVERWMKTMDHSCKVQHFKYKVHRFWYIIPRF